MNLPNQSQPIHRSGNTNFTPEAINPSGIACTICKAACSALAPTPKALCLAACDATVC